MEEAFREEEEEVVSDVEEEVVVSDVEEEAASEEEEEEEEEGVVSEVCFEGLQAVGWVWLLGPPRPPTPER